MNARDQAALLALKMLERTPEALRLQQYVAAVRESDRAYDAQEPVCCVRCDTRLDVVAACPECGLERRLTIDSPVKTP